MHDTQLTAVTYQADIVEWQDKTQIPPARLAALNQRLAATQPGEGAAHVHGEKGKVGINLIGIAGLKRLDPGIRVAGFKKISDGLPLNQRTQAGVFLCDGAAEMGSGSFSGASWCLPGEEPMRGRAIGLSNPLFVASGGGQPKREEKGSGSFVSDVQGRPAIPCSAPEG